jgi:hypothetical protein
MSGDIPFLFHARSLFAQHTSLAVSDKGESRCVVSPRHCQCVTEKLAFGGIADADSLSYHGVSHEAQGQFPATRYPAASLALLNSDEH